MASKEHLRAVESAVEVILNTRDFCGNEREAVRDLCADLGMTLEWQKIYMEALVQANQRWEACRRHAGVRNPARWQRRY